MKSNVGLSYLEKGGCPRVEHPPPPRVLGCCELSPGGGGCSLPAGATSVVTLLCLPPYSSAPICLPYMAGTCQHSLPGDTKDPPPHWRAPTNIVASLGVSSAEMKQWYRTVTRLYRWWKLQECVPSLFTNCTPTHTHPAS